MVESGVVEIGYVARAHGIRGELKIVTHDASSMVLADAAELSIGGDVFAVRRARRANKFWIVTLDDVADRNRAETLRGSTVSVDRELISLDDDEVLLSDLVGCTAFLKDGTEWGQVMAIEPGLQDRLILHHEGLERLLPFVPELVADVDIDARTIVVTPPEGWPEAPLAAKG